MTLRGFTPVDTRLVTVAGPGLVDGNRLAVPGQRLAEESAGLLLPRGTDGEAVPVRLLPVRGLPADVVLLPESLAAEHRLTEAAHWQLNPAQATTAGSVELESPAALVLDDAAALVARSPLLSGHVFGFGDVAQDVWIDLDGLPFRVRSATARDGRSPGGLLSIGPDTRISVFAPGARSAVDIVVLADCSGSMGVDDIPDARESARFTTRRANVTRMDALRRALRSMIDVRTRVDGLVTRFALVGFDLTARTLFPETDGMAEVSASDQRALEELRGAVTLLHYDNRGTDIGRALHKAAELLHRHGVPGNERLIVLVSDGAHWTPMKEDRSGESVGGTEDPVSLMEELHSGLGIRLHAVGISDPRMFDEWWQQLRRRDPTLREPHQNLVPNHGLLSELVAVAGGDRHRIGGMDVLEEYFAELGSGVVRSVGRPGPPRLPALQLDQERLAALAAEPRRAAAEPERDRRWKEEVEQVVGRYAAVCEASRTRLGYTLFRDSTADLQRLNRTAISHESFVAWLAVAYQVFHERLHAPLRYPKKNVPGLVLPELTVPLWDGRLGELHVLRNYYLHERDLEERQAGNRLAGEVILRCTGRYTVAEEDTDGWHRLQLGLLQGVSGVLTELWEVLAAPEAVPVAVGAEHGEEPGPAAPPDGTIRVVAQGFD